MDSGSSDSDAQFKRIDRDSEPMRANSYAPDILFKDTRRPPTVTFVEHTEEDARSREEERKRRSAQDAQYVEIDHNPVDDRRTKSIEIIGSDQISNHSGNNTTPARITPSVRQQTPQSLERIRQIQEHKRGSSARFPGDRRRSGAPKPPLPVQQPLVPEKMDMRENMIDFEEEDDLMRASERPRRRAVREQVERQAGNGPADKFNEKLMELSHQEKVNRQKMQVSIANHRIALREAMTTAIAKALQDPTSHTSSAIFSTFMTNTEGRRFTSQLFEFEGLAGMPDSHGAMGMPGFGDHVFRH